jgi:hypothetical protein
MSVDLLFAAQQDDYRPTRRSLSNGEVSSTGIICGGAVANICRELLAARQRIAFLESDRDELAARRRRL